MYTYICIYVYTYIHIYTYMQTVQRTAMPMVCACACACVCVCVCMYADFHEPRILRVCSKDTSSKDTSSKVCMLTFTNRASPSRKQRCLCVWATSRSTGPVPCIPCAAGS